MQEGFKKRRPAAEKTDPLRQAAEAGCRRLQEARAERGGFLSTPAALLEAAAASHAVAEGLRKDPRLQLRGAEGLAGHIFLPRAKVVILLLGFDERSCGGPFGSQQADLYLALNQTRMFEDALQHVRRVTSLHKANTPAPVALIMNHLELYKYLNLSCMDLNVRLLPCYGAQETIEHIVRLAATSTEVLDHYDTEAKAITRGPIVDARINSVLPAIPAHLRLSGDDLCDMLAGRTSNAICQEHFGWPLAVARSVQSAIQNDSIEP